MKLIGRRIGNIRIESLLGKGGMGRVYRGFDEKLQRPVAVKTLRRRVAFSEEGRARFLREARLLSQLNHPNICQVHDLIEGSESDFLILELIEGHLLSDLIEGRVEGRAGAFAEDQKLRIAEAVAEAMAAAHAEQIVHRDLKPDNIMIVPGAGEGVEDRVKVLDFGIARPVWEVPSGSSPARSPAPSSDALPGAEPGFEPSFEPSSDPDPSPDPDRTQAFRPASGPLRTEASPSSSQRSGLTPSEDSFFTSEDLAVGTPAYMSPEQARNEPLTTASDLYSFGIVLQELLSGRRAVPDLPPEELLDQVRQGKGRAQHDLSPEMAGLIATLTDPDPSRRPTARQAALRLRELRGLPERRRRSRRLAGWAAVALLVLGVGMAAFFAYSQRQARLQTEIAQRFTEEAHEVEAFLRQAYLAPVHDLGPTLERAEQRRAALRRQMEARGSISGGPGQYALGRIALALDRYAAARDHFSAAWEAGYRPPQVASGLGLASFELYRQRRARLETQGESPARQAAIAELDETLRQPAQTYLALGREALAALRQGREESGPEELYRSPVDSLDYVEALQAFHEERHDDALARAETLVRQAPLFFEGYLLLGKIHRLHLEEHDRRADYPSAVAAYERAREALVRAADVGRSHPGTHLELCELERSRTVLELYKAGEGDPGPDPFIAQGREACATVLRIAPNDTTARLLLAQLGLREAEASGESEASLRTLRQAESWVQEALALGAEDARAYKALGHLHMVEADWLIYARQGEAQDALAIAADATEAYQRAHQLSPRDPSILNALANSHSLRATAQIELGEDPEQSIAAALAEYRRAAALGPEDSTPLGNMILLFADQARYEVDRGRDPTPVVVQAEATFAQAHKLNPGYHNGYNALAQVLLAAAEATARQGGDPEPFFSRARELCAQALASTKVGYYEWLCLLQEAQARAEYALAHGQDPGVHLRRGRELLASFRDQQQADVELEVEGTLGRIEGESLLRAGERSSGLRALAAARTVLDRAVEEEQELARALLERARVALLAGDLRQVEDDLTRGLEVRPRSVPFHLLAAELAVRQAGSAASPARAALLARGREHLRRVEEIYPGHPEAHELAAALERSSSESTGDI